MSMASDTGGQGTRLADGGNGRLSAAHMEGLRLDVLERRPPVLAAEYAREKLRAAAAWVKALSEQASGELAAEARLLWLYSILPLRTPHDLAGALTLVNDVTGFVENWSDNFDPRRRSTTPERDRFEEAAAVVEGLKLTEPGGPESREFIVDRLRQEAEATGERKPLFERDEEAFYGQHVGPTLKACMVAMVALTDLVDEMREGAPEALR